MFYFILKFLQPSITFLFRLPLFGYIRIFQELLIQDFTLAMKFSYLCLYYLCEKGVGTLLIYILSNLSDGPFLLTILLFHFFNFFFEG